LEENVFGTTLLVIFEAYHLTSTKSFVSNGWFDVCFYSTLVGTECFENVSEPL